MKIKLHGEIFFTADTHFGHANIIDFNRRPFTSPEEMEDRIIRNINSDVPPGGTLILAGDFTCHANKEKVRELRNRIHCKNIHFVKGNHDKDYSQDHIFTSVSDRLELKTDYGLFIVSHFPMVEWEAAHYGSVHLHGHIHTTGEYNQENLHKKYIDRFQYGHKPKDPDLPLRIYDVGVDANNYRPVSLYHLAEIFNLPRLHK